jgi:hypothetical protein
MGVLTPVIEVATLAMFHPREDLPLRSTIALQCIRDDDAWDILTPFEQCAKELLRGLRIPPTLHQDIEDVVILIHRAPQVMAFAIDREAYLVQVPLVARSRPSATELIRVGLSKLPAPLADRFVGHSDATFK